MDEAYLDAMVQRMLTGVIPQEQRDAAFAFQQKHLLSGPDYALLLQVILADQATA